LRRYIFTTIERKRLERWLETGEEDAATRKLFSRVRVNLNEIKTDVELLSITANTLSKMGRLMGHVRFPETSTSASQSDASTSTQTNEDANTSPASKPS